MTARDVYADAPRIMRPAMFFDGAHQGARHAKEDVR